MIPGVFYIGADIPLELETEADLTDATLTVLVKLPGGTVKEYDGTVKNYSSITATIPAADNTVLGEIFVQAKVVIGDITRVGGTDSLMIFDAFVVPT